jgi:hypothetical protein
VPETILGEMLQHHQDSSTDAEQLTLVCQRCTQRFHFDYSHRQNVRMGTIPLPLDEAMDHAWFAIEGECDPSNFCPPLTLIAIRPHGTNSQDVEREFPKWSDHGLCCDNGHLIVTLSLLEQP